jgi:hypothetical protein
MKKLLSASALMAVIGILSALPVMAGSILIVNGSAGTSEPGTTAAITDNLETLHLAVGNTVTISSDIPANLVPYSQVWDIRFSNTFALSVDQRAQYLDFLQTGGGMFLMGENASFEPRNNSVLAMIAEAGGGSLGFVVPGEVQTVLAPFNAPNAVSTVVYAAPGGVNGTGTGDWITKVDGLSQGTGVAWGVGDLSNAAAGALTVIFDVNFMMNTFDLPHSQNLTKNLIGFVQGEVEPPPPSGVPDAASTLLLVGFGLAGMSRLRRFVATK